MKKLAFAALALLLGACATAPNGNGNGSAARTAAAGTQYCWQERLNSAGGTMTCNWSSSFRDACDATELTSIQAARYTAPAKTRMCNNGQWLVEVSPKG
jgi:hypothetical protein